MEHKQIRKSSYEIDGILFIQKIFGVDRDSFNILLDELPVYIWMHDENRSIVYANHCFKKQFGTCQQQPCYQCVMGEKDICRCCVSTKILEQGKTEHCKLCKRKTFGYDINIFHTPIINSHGQKFILKSSIHIIEADFPTDNRYPY